MDGVKVNLISVHHRNWDQDLIQTHPLGSRTKAGPQNYIFERRRVQPYLTIEIGLTRVPRTETGTPIYFRDTAIWQRTGQNLGREHPYAIPSTFHRWQDGILNFQNYNRHIAHTKWDHSIIMGSKHNRYQSIYLDIPTYYPSPEEHDNYPTSSFHTGATREVSLEPHNLLFEVTTPDVILKLSIDTRALTRSIF